MKNRILIRLSALAAAAIFGLGLVPAPAHAAPGDGYVSDLNDGTIVQISASTGAQTTFASGLNIPTGLAFDPAGNLYEADNGSGKIDKFSPSGVETTFASGLNQPYGLATDPLGNVYEADNGSGTIFKFSPLGLKTTLATGLGGILGLAIAPNGNLYVIGTADPENTYITRVSQSGIKTIVAAVPAGGYQGLTCDAAGDLYAANTSDGNVYKLNPSVTAYSEIPSNLAGLIGVTCDKQGNVYAVDYGGSIYKYDPTGAAEGTYTSGLDTPAFLAFQPAVVPEPSTWAAGALTVLAAAVTLRQGGRVHRA